MSNVLFIKANDRPADQAISVKLYNTFWRAIKNPIRRIKLRSWTCSRKIFLITTPLP